MKFYFVRHGETDYNKTKKTAGRIDVSLNQTGIGQAKESAKNIKESGIIFDIIISSDLKRAKETAEIIKTCFPETKLIEDSRISERDFGDLSGKTRDEMEKAGATREKDLKQEYDYRSFNGESVEDVKARLINFIEDTKEKYKGEIVLAVAHGGIIRLLHHLYGEGLDHIKMASIHEFDL